MSINNKEGTNSNSERRSFLKKSAIAGVGAMFFTNDFAAKGKSFEEESCLELPPKNAKSYNVTCQYCMVQCGYKATVWEQGTGVKKKGSYTSALSGDWIAPSMITSAVKNGKDVFISVVPDKECVINEGDFSVRGGTNAQTLFSKNSPSSKNRLTHPMIRKNGELVKVSWDEAITFTANKLSKVIKENGPDALALIWGDWLYGFPTHAILKLWFEGIGSSSYAGNGWAFDEESSGVSHALGSGSRSFTVLDFEKTKLLVTAGANLFSNGTVWYNRFYLKNASAKQIVIDPRKSAMAGHAEERGGLHLMLKPGTDFVLATAITQEVLKREAWDKEFVSKYVVGFDKVKEVALNEKFSIENASKVTGVPASKIKAAADLMIENKGQTMLLHEKGIQHQMAAFENQFSYTTLGLILGNVGKEGACSSRAGGHPRGTWYWPQQPKSREHNNDIFKSLRNGKIKVMWAFGSNVYKQIPNLKKNKPLIADSFFIVQDRIITEMNKDADVVFPAATWGEIDAVLASEDRRVRRLDKFMDAPGEAKPDWWIVAQIAKKMNFVGFDWKDESEIWSEIISKASDVKDMSWETLKDAGTNGIQYPFVDGKSVTRLYSDEMEAILGKRFFTKDNKIHLEEIELVGKLDVKKYEWSEIDDKNPLMIFDYRLDELWNTGYTYWVKPNESKRTPDCPIEINTEDATIRGIKDGDWVIVQSNYGECTAKAKVHDGIIQGSAGIVALFPKKNQEFNMLTPPSISPINGNFTTMVAGSIRKA